MSAFSCLRILNYNQLILRLIKNGGPGGRGSHGGRQFPMRPTVYDWRKFKDFLHFYTMLGLIPLTLITTYINITVGPAELTEIPEGYEPEHWEYYKSPVSRLFAKYLQRDKRVDYEGMVCYMNEESEKMIMKRVEKMVKDFMMNRNDYQSWYYRPIDAYHIRVDREDWKFAKDHRMGQLYDVTNEDIFSDGGSPK